MRKPTSLRTDLTAPLPLGELKAIERAAMLRERDPGIWSYPTIADAVRLYHGFDRSPNWYQRKLDGRVPKRHRPHNYTRGATRAA